MPRGGPRPGSGRPKSVRPPMPKVKEALAEVEAAISREGWVEPLEYMMRVYNDPDVDGNRRDRMAIAAAPYRHVRKEADEPGKKAARQAKAEEAVSNGKFAVREAPKLVVNNKR